MNWGRYQVRTVVVPRAAHAVHSTHKTPEAAFSALGKFKRRFGRRSGRPFVYDGHQCKRLNRCVMASPKHSEPVT